MQINVLTYDHPHRKTQDLLYRLCMSGYKPWVLTIPFEIRKNHIPLYVVKPEPLPFSIYEQCEMLGFSVKSFKPDEFNGELFLVGGAGILPADFVRWNMVINAHCGWIPAVRGLDSLKWAIYYGEPIGVTTHIVDERTDMGKIIERREVPLYPTDTIHSIAQRQYELEIEMLVSAVGKIDQAQEITEPGFKPHRRMKHSQELQMIDRLNRRLMEMNYESRD